MELRPSVPKAGPTGEQEYDYARLVIDPEGDTTHAMVLRLVGRDRRVLELGTAAGHMSALLKERGCSVTGVEIHPEMAAGAEAHCERMIVGDLDLLDLGKELEGERFDVVIAADVLEHLKDPARLLAQARELIEPDGFIVASVPNIAHGSVRLALLGGAFDYREIGLLDRTHLRFFTRSSLVEMFERAGYAIGPIQPKITELDVSEIRWNPAVELPGVREMIESDPDALAYQFVIVAYPDPVDQRAETGRLREENAELRRQLERERVALARLRRTLPVRAFHRLRSLPGLRWWRRRRLRSFEREAGATGTQGDPEP